MNVKSKFDTEEEYVNRRPQYMRGACGNTLNMIAEVTRKDEGEVHAPGFIERIFRALGWKTESGKHPTN